MIAQFPHAIDNTMRKQLVKCQKAVHYQFELGLHPLTESRVDLHAGAAYAKGMETLRRAFWTEGKTQDFAVGAAVAAVYGAYGNFQPPAKSNKTADKMAGAIPFYVSEFPLAVEKLVPFEIEFGFAFGIGIPHPEDGRELEYCGRFDCIAQHADTGDFWVVDEKTTSQMGDKWANQWALDSQMTGYCWGANKWLAERGYGPVKGAVINGIAIRLHDYSAMRLPVYRQDWEIERWFDQMREDVYEWICKFETGRHKMALDHACAYYLNPCEFAPLCSSRNPERLFDGSYRVEFWNPKERKD